MSNNFATLFTNTSKSVKLLRLQVRCKEFVNKSLNFYKRFIIWWTAKDKIILGTIQRICDAACTSKKMLHSLSHPPLPDSILKRLSCLRQSQAALLPRFVLWSHGIFSRFSMLLHQRWILLSAIPNSHCAKWFLCCLANNYCRTFNFSTVV